MNIYLLPQMFCMIYENMMKVFKKLIRFILHKMEKSACIRFLPEVQNYVKIFFVYLLFWFSNKCLGFLEIDLFSAFHYLLYIVRKFDYVNEFNKLHKGK